MVFREQTSIAIPLVGHSGQQVAKPLGRNSGDIYGSLPIPLRRQSYLFLYSWLGHQVSWALPTSAIRPLSVQESLIHQDCATFTSSPTHLPFHLQATRTAGAINQEGTSERLIKWLVQNVGNSPKHPMRGTSESLQQTQTSFPMPSEPLLVGVTPLPNALPHKAPRPI